MTVHFVGSNFRAGVVNAKVFLSNSTTAVKVSHPHVMAGDKLDITFSPFPSPAGVTGGTVKITPTTQTFHPVIAPFTYHC